jgi:hypothetical protein
VYNILYTYNTTGYTDERYQCNNNFIPIIDTALFSTVDIGCYNAATNEISTPSDENFLYGGILSTGKSFALSEPELA